MQEHAFQVFADYHQIYLQNDDAAVEMPGNVTDRDIARRVAAAPFIVVIHTARNTEVPLKVRVHDAEPALDIDGWQHVAECSLDVPSGNIVVAGCTDYFPDAARIAVAPSTYQVRVCFRGLDTLSIDELDGSDEYLVDLWPGSPRDVAVVKEFHG